MSRENIAAADLRAWLDAWRGLGDNPLARHWRAMERRRRERQPWIVRRLAWVLAALAFLIALLFASFFIFNPWWSSGGIDPTLYLLPLLAAACAGYGVWLIQGLGGAVARAAGLLRRTVSPKDKDALDDILAATPLSDREIAAAALGVILPPLWRRVISAGGVLWLISYLSAIQLGAEAPWREQFLTPVALRTLAQAPLTVAVFAAGGVLAAANLALYYLVLGRESRWPGSAAVAGITAVLAQALWLAFGLALMFNVGEGFDAEWAAGLAWWQWPAGLGAMLIAAALPWLLAWAALRLSRGWSWLRTPLMLGGPLSLLLLFGLTFAGLVLPDYGEDLERCLTQSGFCSWTAYELLRGWGTVQVLNPAALPPELAWPEVQSLEPWHAGRLMWLFYPLGACAMQLIGTRLLLGEALAAIRARRQPE